MAAGGGTKRARLMRGGVVGVGLALVATGCVIDDESTTDRSAGGVEFTIVRSGDSWESIAERLLGCDDADAIADAVDHLAVSNPLIDEAGLAADASLAFDPAHLADLGCDASEAGSESASPADDVSESASQSSVTSVSPDAAGDGDVVSTEPAADAPDDGALETPAEPGDGRDLSSPAVDEVPPSPGPDLTDGSRSLVAFSEDFAEESSLERFRWQVHHAVPFHGTPQTWQGDHDLECNPPGTFRTIDVPEEGPDPGESAYWCAPGGPETAHLMTSFRTDGYAQVAFSPNRSFDHVRRICWDQNQTDLGNRKWTQMIVVPEDTFATNDERLDYVDPRIEGGPGAAGVFLTDDVFLLVMTTGSTVTYLGRDQADEDFRGFTTTDKKRRYTTCIEDLENGTVRIELEREEAVEVREQVGAFPDGPARVIFQDDTYNSTKAPSPVDEPFTWHWDNIVVQTLDTA